MSARKLFLFFKVLKIVLAFDSLTFLLEKVLNPNAKVTLSSIVARLSPSKELYDLAQNVISKESNELVVDLLLPLISNDPNSFKGLKTAKLAMKTVYIKHMNEDNLINFGPEIYNLVLKEHSPTSGDSLNFVCQGLAKLSTLGYDWEKFLNDAESKPISLLRRLPELDESHQILIITWLLSIEKASAPKSRALTILAIAGHPKARKFLNSTLSKSPNHHLGLGSCLELLDGSINSYKFLKSLIKSEDDAVTLFEKCHQLGHDWVTLALRVSKNIPMTIESNFSALFQPGFMCLASIKTLSQFCPVLMKQSTTNFATNLIARLKFDEAEIRVWKHSDKSSVALSEKLVPISGGISDPKLEKSLKEKQLNEEMGIRDQIQRNINDIVVLSDLVSAINLEEFGVFISRFLTHEIYGVYIARLLYSMARGWRPLVVSALLRHHDIPESYIKPDWNLSSAPILASSIKRLICTDNTLMDGSLSFCLPLVSLWFGEEQFDFLQPFADKLEDLNCVEAIKSGRVEIVEALLKMQNRTPSVDKILSIIGGQMTLSEESVFIKALLSENDSSRKTALESLHSSWTISNDSQKLSKFYLAIELLKHDEVCMQVATVVSLKLSEFFVSDVESLTAQLFEVIETASEESWTIEAAKEALSELDGKIIIPSLLSEYSKLYQQRRPEIVNVRSKDLDLTQGPRAAIVESIGMVSKLDEVDIVDLFGKFIHELFLDSSSRVNEVALQSSISILQAIEGELYGHKLGELFEDYLSKSKSKSEMTLEESDRVRVFVIILLGKVSQYMSHESERRENLVKTMIETLKTPSESVQSAVAEALIPLFQGFKSEAKKWILQLKQLLWNDKESMACRRGAAYGISALCKACGLVSIRECSLMEACLQPFSNQSAKGEARPTTERKESSLFCLELLAKSLGSAFEPYVMGTIDTILAGFADGKVEVREACLEAAKSLMNCVSSAGARLLLPALLSRATNNDASWRAKVGVLEWLGAMASMTRSVLTPRLPTIIPVLIETGLNDSHGQVQETARKALIQYGRAVGSPEMRSLIPYILEALANPSTATIPCFNRILDTRFCHVIDGPSLALLEPLLRRALIDRSAGAATLKKLAGQIIGNLATSLVDAADFAPYLGTLVPALCGCLEDPVPQVRAHAAKVLGMLVKTAEMDGRPSTLAIVSGLLPSLEEKLVVAKSSPSDSDSIDRAGAAQAMSEIMAAKGTSFTGKVLQEKIGEWIKDESGSLEKEAALLILGYLPGAFVFYDRLEALYKETVLGKLLTSILNLTADRTEAVRESASKTAKTVFDLLVGAGIDRSGLFKRLLSGFGSPKWRVRLTCLTMMERALASHHQESENEAGEDESGGAIKVTRLPTAEELLESGVLDKVGIQTLQTRLYLARFDPSNSQLRSIALNIWKALSYHSPRTLTDILPLLVTECANSGPMADEQVQRALEDLFTKLGDRLALPFLENSWILLQDDSSSSSVSKSSIIDNLITMVRVIATCPELLTRSQTESLVKGLVNVLSFGLSQEECSENAAKLFDCMLFKLLSSPEVINPVVKQIVIDNPHLSDEALLLLINCRPSEVLSVMIPELLAKRPLQLPLIASIFESAANSAVPHAVPVIKELLTQNPEGFEDEQLCLTLRHVLASLNPSCSSSDDDEDESYDVQDTVYHLRLGQLMEGHFEKGGSFASWAFTLIRLYCEGSPGLDHSRLYPVWIPRLIMAVLGKEQSDSAKSSLLVIIGSAQPDHLSTIIQLMRQPISRLESSKSLSLSSWHTALLTALVKSILLPVITGGQTYDLSRAPACEIVSSLLKASPSASAIWGTSAITLLIGALVRLGSDRKAGEGRIAAFSSLKDALLLHPTSLRPFFPQLQRLLSQAITSSISSDDEAANLATEALAKLLGLLPKPEGLVQEWASMLLAPDDPTGQSVTEENVQCVSASAKTSILKCLRLAFLDSPIILSDRLAHLKEPVLSLLKEMAAHSEEVVRLENSRLIEELAKASFLDEQEFTKLKELAFILK